MTTLEILHQWEQNQDYDYRTPVGEIRNFLAAPDPKITQLPDTSYLPVHKLAEPIIDSHPWDSESSKYLILAWRGVFDGTYKSHGLKSFFESICRRIDKTKGMHGLHMMTDLFEVASTLGVQSHTIIEDFCKQYWDFDWSYQEDSDGQPIFHSNVARYFWALDDRDLADCSSRGHMKNTEVLAKFRPEVLHHWVNSPKYVEARTAVSNWQNLLKVSNLYDDQAMAIVCETPFSIQSVNLLAELETRNPGKYQKEIDQFFLREEVAILPATNLMLIERYPDDVIPLTIAAFSPYPRQSFHDVPAWKQLAEFACARLEKDGMSLVQFFIVDSELCPFHMLEVFLDEVDLDQHPEIGEGIVRHACKQIALPSDKAVDIFKILTARLPKYCFQYIPEHLESKAKKSRDFAAHVLAEISGPEPLRIASSLVNHKKMTSRLGAIELLSRLGEEAIPVLRNAHTNEKSQKVQDIIENALEKLGSSAIPSDSNDGEPNPTDLLAQIESDKRIKLPATPWFDLTKFPLIQKDGTPLSEKAVTYLIQKQSKHKTIDAAPGILPVLDLLDREKNADSALALLNQWLDSDQVAKDRWALVLSGLLGDNRIIPALTPRIQPWCENSRHKLAEYAAQAISLLATEEALMILDTLANRYRSKFKNIGKACKAAFLAAAEARGVTPDELGDLVVPDLGFNSECHKEFDDGKIIAVLQPDFKITWLNPETEKETKSPPSNLSDEGKEELKTLRKILREAVKGQTARLEQMLVRQRRWPVARWQELFEEHPLLQSYASNLVWGIYDSNSELLRTFRRYPNGILAHGSGEMEDLEERDTHIGLVHPLELDDDTLAVWRDHLGRFKVKPPFPQLDRPVEILEENHANRREITFTENVQISGGTFLSRMNKRGWIRGSVIDAGGVTSYYKPFEGAGVEAILFLEEYWVGFDPVDSFPLGKALFATLSTVDRGSYIYDDPQPTDPRVLPFGKVPPIVFSEVIADLKALIEGQSKP